MEEQKVRLITVHLPEEAVEGLDELVRAKKYPNRSEAIRYAIRDLLREELWSLRNSENESSR